MAKKGPKSKSKFHVKPSKNEEAEEHYSEDDLVNDEATRFESRDDHLFEEADYEDDEDEDEGDLDGGRHVLGLDLPEDEDSDEYEDEDVGKIEPDDLKAFAPRKEIGVGLKQAIGKGRHSFYGEEEGEEELGWYSDDREELDQEEEEADMIEKEKLNALSAEDFALANIDSIQIAPTKEAKLVGKLNVELARLAEREEVFSVERNLASLDRAELLALLKKDMPELLALVSEFKDAIAEVNGEITPLLDADKNGLVELSSNGRDYLILRQGLLNSYILNIGFYFLACVESQTSISSHPCISVIFSLREALDEIEPFRAASQKEMALLLEEAVKAKKNTAPANLKRKADLVGGASKKPKQAITASLPSALLKPKKSKQQGVSSTSSSSHGLSTPTLSDAALLAYYEDQKTKLEHARQEKKIAKLDSKHEIKRQKEKAVKEKASAPQHQDDNDESNKTEGRAVNYTILKNKGMLPSRKKDYRNPRVRHRNKYEKAQKKRRYVVKEFKPEVEKYRGEVTGIRSTIGRSTKLS